jgi:hypothetical protein
MQRGKKNEADRGAAFMPPISREIAVFDALHCAAINRRPNTAAA